MTSLIVGRVASPNSITRVRPLQINSQKPAKEGRAVSRRGALRPKSVDRVGDENANAEDDQADNRDVN